MTIGRAVVTGGAGVIGRALLERLAAAGTAVRCLDVQPPPPWLPDGVQYVQGDLRVLDGTWISSFDPDVLFHLAATFERSEESPDFWRESAEHNVVVSRRVLEAAAATPTLRRVVFASSYLVYDPALYLLDAPPDGPRPLEEGAPISPRNVCGAAKLLHEHELDHVAAAPSTTFDAVSARIFRVYGRGSRDVVSRWARQALAGEPLTTYGTESYFDYVYADDVAEGLARLGTAAITGVVNLGSGRARRVAEVVEALRAEIDGVRVESAGDATAWEASQASTARLEAATGWTPPTALEAGVEQVVAYERTATAPELRRRVVEPRRVHVLVTSLSRKTPVVDAFREAFLALAVDGTVTGADGDALAPGRFEVDDFWAMPPLADLSDDALVEAVAERGADLVVPTRDGELLRFARLRERFAERGVDVAVSPEAAVAACIDKAAFADECARAGLPAIPTATSADDAAWPVLVVKERFGAGSRSVGLRLDQDAARHHAAGLADPVFQPFVEGPEYSIDAFVARSGAPVGAVARARSRVSGGESQVTELVDRPDLVRLGLRAVEALGIRGHAVLQAIDGPEGPVLVECNARLGGASALAFACGLKSAQYLVQERLGEAPTPLHPVPPPVTLFRRPADRIRAG